MSYFIAYKSKTTSSVKGPLESDDFRTAVPSSREKQLIQPSGDSRTFVSAVTIQLNSGKDEESLSSSANQAQQNTSEATDYRGEGNRMSVLDSSLMSRQSTSSIAKREYTVVSRRTTTSTSKTATRVMSMESSSVLRKDARMSVESSSMLQKEASSKRETSLMSKESSSMLQNEASSSSKRETANLMSVESSSMLQKEASSGSSLLTLESSSTSQKKGSWMPQRGEATLTSSKKTSMTSTDYHSESKVAETNQLSLKSSSTSEKKFLETRFSARISSLRSSESSFKSIESSSTSQNESSTTSQEEIALPGTRSRELGDKGWYYELLLRLENLSWSYQNLEAEYAFLEKLMAEQKQDLKKAQGWAQSMRKQMPTAEASQVSLD